ncbi:hypothetical protein TWF281_007049 [Arthrobotrys megalospora]
MDALTVALGEQFFEIPYAAEADLSAEETAKYEKMLYSYYDHRSMEDEHIYAHPVVDYLRNINNPTEVVSNFLKLLADTQSAINHGAGSSISSLDLESEQQYQNPDDLGGSFVEVQLEQVPIDEVPDVADSPMCGSKLLSAPYYTANDTDFAIHAGTESNKVTFMVHTYYLKKSSPFFKEMLEDGSCGGPDYYTYTCDEDPIAVDWYLAYLYGVPFKFPSEVEVEPLMRFTRNMIRLAINTRLYELVEDITEQLGKSFSVRYWPPGIHASLMDLYGWHKVHLKPRGHGKIKITIAQLVAWLRNLKKAGKIADLKGNIKINKEPDSYPGSGVFLKDLSIALCRALHEIPVATNHDAVTPQSGSSVPADGTGIPDEPNGSNFKRI